MMRVGIVNSIGGFAVLMALLSSSSISIATHAQVSVVVSAAAIDSFFAKFVSAHDPGCALTNFAKKESIAAAETTTETWACVAIEMEEDERSAMRTANPPMLLTMPTRIMP